jgi:hypothetical protein
MVSAGEIGGGVSALAAMEIKASEQARKRTACFGKALTVQLFVIPAKAGTQ